MRVQVSHLYKTAGFIIFLYTAVFSFLRGYKTTKILNWILVLLFCRFFVAEMQQSHVSIPFYWRLDIVIGYVIHYEGLYILYYTFLCIKMQILGGILRMRLHLQLCCNESFIMHRNRSVCSKITNLNSHRLLHTTGIFKGMYAELELNGMLLFTVTWLGDKTSGWREWVWVWHVRRPVGKASTRSRSDGETCCATKRRRRATAVGACTRTVTLSSDQRRRMVSVKRL
jgi:hypothetical protein